jgi:hypothetical protein
VARFWWWVGALPMLAACSSTTSTPSASAATVPQSPTAIVSLSPAPAPTPTPTPTLEPFLAPVGPTCAVSQLNMRAGTSGAGAGSAATVLVFTDTGGARCTLRGTPVVRFLDRAGQVVKMVVVDQPGGFFPPVPPLTGVGLLPLTNPGSVGMAGVRGQAGLGITWSDNMCAISAPITRVEITLPSGSLSVPLQISGFGTTLCQKPAAIVTPFEPAEAAA